MKAKAAVDKQVAEAAATAEQERQAKAKVDDELSRLKEATQAKLNEVKNQNELNSARTQHALKSASLTANYADVRRHEAGAEE